MSRKRLTPADLATFASAAAGWEASEQLLEKTFRFATYGDGVAFAVAIAFVAEARDHHPDLSIGYRLVRVGWTTHDAGGTTELDREMAAVSDALAARHSATSTSRAPA